MGTRSLTYVYDEPRPEPKKKGNAVVCMYRQMDGYPSGHGTELATFLTAIQLVNGITDYKATNLANGMACLAAQIVAHFKTEIGQFYLLPTKQPQDAGQEYEYHVFPNAAANGVEIDVYECGYKTKKVLLFSGPVGELQTFIDTPVEEEA